MSNLTDFRVPPARTITAGNGLTGGGTLAADRTVTMGTPTTLTGGTTNATTADSHTHAITNTDSRSTNNTTSLLNAKAMFDHTASTATDHDARYARRDQNLSDLTNVTTARTNLGLGTGATSTVTTSQTDTTANRLLKVADFGVGSVTTPLLTTFSDAGLPNGFYTWSSTTTDSPNTAGGGAIKLNRSAGAAMWIATESSGSSGAHEPTMWIRSTSFTTNDWGAWRKVAQDHINFTAGNGLTGGGTLAANRTFTMGTPSTLNTTSTNATTAESHTHAITTASANTASTIVARDGSGNFSAGTITATTFSGNATTATTLQTTRAINGTNFNGSAAITTANWGTSRNLSIGGTSKAVDGSAAVTWTEAEIAANTAVTLKTARDINGVSFNGSAAITLPTVNTSGNQTVAGNKSLSGKLHLTTQSSAIGTAASTGIFEIGNGSAGSAGMSFHRTGYAINWGLDSDNTVKLGGWSVGASVFNLQITSDGNLTARGNVTAYSDIRLKTDIVEIDNALDKVQQLTGYTFLRTDNNVRQTGVIAQDVEKVLPEAVITDGNYLSVAYGNMVGLLINAIKELRTEVKELATKVEELEAR
jgi:hypothetical protein